MDILIWLKLKMIRRVCCMSKSPKGKGFLEHSQGQTWPFHHQ
nr:hypothetical protein Q903MT_gene1428 [Picea sitchensis]